MKNIPESAKTNTKRKIDKKDYSGAECSEVILFLFKNLGDQIICVFVKTIKINMRIV